MGFSLSWIAVKGIGKPLVLKRLGLVDTAEPDNDSLNQVAGAELPSGWFLVQMPDCFHLFVQDATLARLSMGCEVLGCQTEEHVMASAAFLWSDGEQRWNVTHESEKGIYDLNATGAPPEEFVALRERAFAQQNEEGGDDADVDYVHDVPIDLAAHITGYRHDETYEPSSSNPPFRRKYSFTRLVIASA